MLRSAIKRPHLQKNYVSLSFSVLYSAHAYTRAQRNSGVAKLGHTGARALETTGCAPPMQALLKIIGAESTVINRELSAKSGQRC